jgi:mono/diheme cytochrome c family protein
MLLCAVLAATACATVSPAVRAQAAQVPTTGQDFGVIERGRYLAILADCAACHTDPADPRPFSGGRAIQTPFGNVVAPNITPDVATGIGSWTEDEFDAAVRRGVMPNGARLYPAMPYPYYTRMSRADVLAIRAYLTTIQPVHKEVTSDELPFPFNIRFGMRVWDALYFDSGEFRPDPRQPADWNRGAWLVEGPGHCGACHTPKSFLGGDKTHTALQGYAIQGWFAPNITADRRLGIGTWSEQDLVEYLKRGHNRFAGASGPMAEEVSDSSSMWDPADLRAVAVYLRSEAGSAGSAEAIAPKDPAMVAGAAIYGDLCSACHAPDGRGVPYLIPSLVDSPAVAGTDPTTVLQVIIRGAQTVATREEPTAPQMPAYGAQLTDDQLAAVATYIRNTWGHAAPAVSAHAVGSARKGLSGQ